jgi:uncharacterized membrane protein YkgB
MKLKKWVQAVLLIIAIVGIKLIVNPEENLMQMVVGYTLLITSIGTISEYGTLFDYMKCQIEKFITK